MRKLATVFLALAFCISITSAQQYPVLTVKEVQEVPQDSLVAADNAGLTAHTTLDDSPYLDDTVSVYGIVMSKVRLSSGGGLTIPSLGNAYVFYIADTTGTGMWRGIHVRASDTVAAVNSLVAILDTGMVVKVTGRVQEFGPSVRSGVPANNFSSTSQFEMDLDPGSGSDFIPVEINPVQRKSRPMPTPIQVSDLFVGSDPQFATGERWEGCYVEVRDVTVVQSTISNNRMTLVVEDASGNRLTVVDDSYYYRVDYSGYSPPVQGSKLQHVRGFIANRFGIAPLYPNDIKIASFPPSVSDVRRAPLVPSSSDGVTVTARVEDTNTGGSVTKAELWYGIDGGELQEIQMTLAKADSAVGTIPAQVSGSLVRYAVVATDNDLEMGMAPQDTTVEFYFYKVIDGDPTIRDIQYTPFSRGNTGFSGARVSLRGVVTSDTGSLGANFITIQDGTQPWSGIMIQATRDSVKMLSIGDDVTITGTVGESYSVTRLYNITGVTTHGRATVPSLVLRTTGAFATNPGGKLDGDPEAEPWESMLVYFKNLTVTQQNADAPGGNYGEFAVNDGSGEMRVDDIGLWKRTYSNGLSSHTGSILLVQGTKIGQLNGLMYYSFSNYKLEPRGASDFTDVQTGVERIRPEAAALRLNPNYPNPFNPSTVITYEIPSWSHVRLVIFDALGREVTTLVDAPQEPGTYAATYVAAGQTSGVYYYRLTADGTTLTGKMVFAK